MCLLCVLQDILAILRAADYLQCNDLKSALGEYFTKLISHDTALKMYVYTKTNNLQLLSLCKQCLSFIEQESNTLKIMESPDFLELSEEHLTALLSRDSFLAQEGHILQAVLRWKEHNRRSVEEMEKVIGCIRLSRFSPREMFTAVQPSGLFSEAAILAGMRVLSLPVLSETKPRGIKSENPYHS